MDPNIYPYMQPPVPKKKKGVGALIFFVVCVAVLAALGFGAYRLLNNVKAEVPVGTRAVVLDTAWSDFFRYPCNVNEEKAHIDEMLTSVKELGADTVLWTARTGTGAAAFRDSTKTLEISAAITANDKWYEFLHRFDPLNYLVQQANRQGIAVVLLATDTENNAAVSFDELDAACAEAIVKKSSRIGLPIAAAADAGENLAFDSTAGVITYQLRSDVGVAESSGESMAAFVRCDDNVPMLAAAVQLADTDALVLGTVTALTEDSSALTLLNTFVDGSAAPDLPALWDGRAIEQTLALAYPTDPTAMIATTNVFLMGTSDPALPLTIEGGTLGGTQTIERNGDKGTWGVLVELTPGANEFVVAQEGGKTLSFTLTNGYSAVAPGGETPDDGSVKAEDGQYLEITATAASALADPGNSDSIRQTLYQGAVAEVINSYRFIRSGKYTWAYQLATDDWVLAKDCKLLEMVPEEDEEAEEEKDPEADPEEEQKAQDEKTTNGDKEADKEADAEDEEDVPLISSVTDAAFTGLSATYDEATRCTVLTFEGEGTPVIYHNWKDNLLSLAFYSAAFEGELPATDSFIKNIATAELETGFVLNITCDDGQLWGWNSEYGDGTTRIYLKHTPTISEAATGPLTGTVVMLDAGHGGEEKGAMGAAGLNAPLEKDVNLAETMAAKYRLEQLGATVVLTRPDDSTVTLQQRLEALNAGRPDFFIALHHNSTELTTDVNKNTGTECYWFYTEGGNLAEHLTANVTGTTGRSLRGVFYDYYYVTRSNICPAVLLETGFMTNPGEYEDVANPVTLLAEGGAVAQAVLQTVQDGFVDYEVKTE